MSLWDIKAYLYRYVRGMPIVKGILRDEMQTIDALRDQLTIDGLILDVATGIGDSLSHLPRAAKVFALDTSRHMLHLARRRYAHRSFIAGDAVTLPFRNGQFALIQCIGLSEYLEDTGSLLASLSDCLAPGAFLLITASPRTLYTWLRKVLGHKLCNVTVERILAAARDAQLTTLATLRSSTQIVFLMRRQDVKK